MGVKIPQNLPTLDRYGVKFSYLQNPVFQGRREVFPHPLMPAKGRESLALQWLPGPLDAAGKGKTWAGRANRPPSMSAAAALRSIRSGKRPGRMSRSRTDRSDCRRRALIRRRTPGRGCFRSGMSSYRRRRREYLRLPIERISSLHAGCSSGFALIRKRRSATLTVLRSCWGRWA